MSNTHISSGPVLTIKVHTYAIVEFFELSESNILGPMGGLLVPNDSQPCSKRNLASKGMMGQIVYVCVFPYPNMFSHKKWRIQKMAYIYI